MNKVKVLVVFILFCSFSSIFAFGKKETEEKKEPLNPEWILSITSFDVNELPASQKLVGDVLTRNLVVALNKLSKHIRVSEEYTYYYEYARTVSLTSAGKSLEARRSDRDQLIFKGEANWQYKNQLKTADTAVETLEENYRKAETDTPEIVVEPVFKLTEGNNTGTFPAPPLEGGEYLFCKNQKADAFLSGKVAEFHGRIYLSLRLYTLYTRSFIYEDELFFSSEDTNQVVDEISGRLAAAVSGVPPAALSVKVDNEDAVILIKNSFAGRGETGVMEHPPETVDVTVFANEYQPASATVDLASGELTELRFDLRPLPLTSLDIEVDETPSPLYRGALYIGESPLTLRSPINSFEYLHTETPRGSTGAAVFRVGQTGNPIYMETIPALDPDAKPLNKARRQYYGAWTRFWISLPAAFLMNGVVSGYRDAYAVHGSDVFAEKYDLYNGVSIGLWVAFGVIAGESLYRIIRYNHTASKSVPVEIKR
jgi:hypothetical protein